MLWVFPNDTQRGKEMSTTFTGHGVTMFSLVSMKGRLKLEMAGLKGRGQTTYSIIKERFGFKGDRQKVYQQFCQYIEEEAKKLKPGDITAN
jgi:uncharacterized protein (DUF2141 family)